VSFSDIITNDITCTFNSSKACYYLGSQIVQTNCQIITAECISHDIVDIGDNVISSKPIHNTIVNCNYDNSIDSRTTFHDTKYKLDFVECYSNDMIDMVDIVIDSQTTHSIFVNGNMNAGIDGDISLYCLYDCR
jgi:hypothetical protein